MSLVFISQYIAFAFSIPIALIACFRAYRHRDHERNMPIVWASLGALLVMIGHASALLAAYFLWTHLITSFTVYTGFLMIYWGMRNLLSKEPPKTTLTGSIIFKVSVVLIITALVLNAGRMLTWIPTDKESSLHYPVELDVWPPWYYEFNLAFYVFHDVIQLMFLVLILGVYLQAFPLYKNTAYRARIIICAIGFFIGAVGISAILTRIGLWATGSDSLTLIRTYQNLKAISFVVSLVGFFIPHRVLQALVSPVEAIKATIKKRQAAQLQYLHKKVTRIAPTVQLHPSMLNELRMLVEISDSRQFIWSHIPRAEAVTPDDEAQRIMELLREGAIIDQPGPHMPPAIKKRNIVKHYCAVARQLQRLEGGA